VGEDSVVTIPAAVPRSPTPRLARTLAAAAGGCILLAVGASAMTPVSAVLSVPLPGSAQSWLQWVGMRGTLLVATVLAVIWARHWPRLILAGVALSVPMVFFEVPGHPALPAPAWVVASCASGAAAPVALIGVLGAAGWLIRSGHPGWGAVVAGTGTGALLVGAAMVGAGWLLRLQALGAWHVGLTAAALAGTIPAVRAGSALLAPAEPPAPRRRIRPVLAAGVAAAALAVPHLSTEARMSRLLGVTMSALLRHPSAVAGVTGALVLLVGLAAAGLAGRWGAAAGLTVAVVQLSVAAPLLLAVWALAVQTPLRWATAVLGVALGAAGAASRRRVPLAAGAAVFCAVALFIAVAATGGAPEKLIYQHESVPGALLLIGLCATATALAGSAAVTVAHRTELPVALGPLAAVLVYAGQLILQATYVGADGLSESSYLNPVHHLATAATGLLVAAAAVGALYGADVLVTRRAERRAAEEIRRQAAVAERERLARPIHDGALQVLALVARHGPELGPDGARLAELAKVHGDALRRLIAGADAAAAETGEIDLRVLLAPYESARVQLALPAEPVLLPARRARELAAAVIAALDNVRRHAGETARAWVLVDDGPREVCVSIRDDGVGIAAGRLPEAAAQGRLGVAQSIVGRVRNLGGSAEIGSDAGAGTEVELRVPRR
jgi:signal transduction histidine kinase